MKNNLIHFLRNQYTKKIWKHLADILIFLGGVRIASYLTYLGIQWGSINKLNPTVLCISRDFFSKDIIELRKRTNINYPCILGGYVRFQQNWFPKEMQIQTYYNNYNGPEKDKAITKSTEYARRILAQANKVQKINAIMSANFNYWQDVGFISICKELGIPFLVLSRENVTTPKVCELFIKDYRELNYKFNGTAIAVGGNMTAKIFEANPSIIDMANVWVTGLPRLDIWKEIKTDTALNSRPYITLLTYTDGYGADKNFKEVVKIFAVESLNYHNGVAFIIKCKNYDDKIEVLKILKNHDTSKLKFLYDVPLYNILPKSRLVINYNSLSIVEAVMARAHVAVPDWGDCRTEEESAMCSPNDPISNKAVFFVKSPGELISTIKISVEKPGELLNAAIAHDFVNKYFYVPIDSTISQKVEEFICFYLQK